ncbi:hypothetical protein LIA77_08761 [Sarocladium implicatum]|nr:hypothetical protein LIA77_08761 [Sarocladium implicatum]
MKPLRFPPLCQLVQKSSARLATLTYPSLRPYGKPCSLQSTASSNALTTLARNASVRMIPAYFHHSGPLVLVALSAPLCTSHSHLQPVALSSLNEDRLETPARTVQLTDGRCCEAKARASRVQVTLADCLHAGTSGALLYPMPKIIERLLTYHSD